MKTLNELKNYCGGDKEIQISRDYWIDLSENMVTEDLKLVKKQGY